jgi:hypothetical protein
MRNGTIRRVGAAVAVALVFTTLAPTAAWAARSSSGAGAESSWIVTLQPGFAATAHAPSLATGAGGRAGLVFEHALNGFVFEGSAKAAANLARNPNVRTVTADGATHIAADTIPDGVSRIAANSPSAPDAYEAGYRGAGARIAILDTGIDLSHPDLVASLDLNLARNCMTIRPDPRHRMATAMGRTSPASPRHRSTGSASSVWRRQPGSCPSRSSTTPGTASGRTSSAGSTT